MAGMDWIQIIGIATTACSVALIGFVVFAI
jgi:hypothetical protein